MTLFRWRDFAPNTKLPATWTDGIENLLGNYASANFVIDQPSATSLRVKAGTAHDARVLAVQGKPRWTEADLSATVSGGAGTILLYAVSTADSFGSASGPPVQETDTTTRTFTLKANGTPSGSGGEAISRAIASITWDGAKILNWVPLVGARADSGGRCYVAAEESRTSASYGLMTTADQVQGVVVSDGGLLEIDFQALWKATSAQAQAAIFIGANQLKVQAYGSSLTPSLPRAQAAQSIVGTVHAPLVSAPVGLVGLGAPGYSSAADVTTGQALGTITTDYGKIAIDSVALDLAVATGGGGAADAAAFGGTCKVFGLAAGVYDVSVQFCSPGGGTAVTKERRLWVRSRP